MFVPPGFGAQKTQETIGAVRDLETGEYIRFTDDRQDYSLNVAKPLHNYISFVLDDGLIPAEPPEPPAGPGGVDAFRFGLGFRVVVGTLLSDDLPDNHLALGAVDLMAISNDVLSWDGGIAREIRQWNNLGGQAWLMLDKVEAETAEALFAGDLPFQVVDRVSLTDFGIAAEKGELGREAEFEEPVELVRVFVNDDVKVLYWVGDWPAAFIVPRGDGKILVTTLGLTAWTVLPIDYKHTRELPNSEFERSLLSPSYYPTEELVDISQRLRMETEDQAAHADEFQAYLTQRVGYTVVSRNIVGMVLFVFVLAILVSGIVLHRMERLALMLGVAPVAVAVSVAVLVAIGGNATSSIPQTVGAIQWLRITPGSHDAVVEGELAFYHPSRTAFSAGASGGMFTLDTSGQQGVRREMIWDDRDSFHWNELSLPAGLRFAKWVRPVHLPQLPMAHVAIGKELTGELRNSQWDDLADAILLFPNRRPIPVEIGDDGKLRLDSGSPLGEGQFISGKLLSDEQRRRQALVASIYERRAKSKFLDRPLLLAWTEAEPEGLHAPGDPRRFHATMITIPVEFHRPDSGPVAVGSSLLPFKSVASPVGEGQAAVYDALQGKWVELTRKSSFWVRFQLPPELLPVDVATATVEIDLNVPSRTVDFRTYRNGEAVAQGDSTSPGGTLTFILDATKDFEVDEQGGILFGIRVSDPPVDTSGPGAKSDKRDPKWKIGDVRMTVVGQIPE
jgi:hypothetical protein